MVKGQPLWNHGAKSSSLGDPLRRVREQAKWNGRPDPDDEVLQQLIRIRQRRDEAPVKGLLNGTARLLDGILKEREEFVQWAIPHLHRYLPDGTPIRGAVAMAAFLPNYAFSMNGIIVISLTDRFWSNDASVVFNLLVHELFHNGFVQHQRGISPNDARDGHELVQALLWQMQNEGMATYVAYRAKPPHLVFGDYKLLEQSGEVRNHFAQCRKLLMDLNAASRQTLPALRERLWRECNLSRVSYIVGASMARRIEQLSGVAALVKTIRQGPQAFLGAYQRTSPESDFKL